MMSDRGLWKCSLHNVMGDVNNDSYDVHARDEHQGVHPTVLRFDSVEPQHFIKWTLHNWGVISAVVECKGDHLSSCWITCAHPGCTEHEDADNHMLKSYGKCIMAEWTDSEGATDLYGGADTSLRDGEIVFSWEPDNPTWRYKEDIDTRNLGIRTVDKKP